MGHNELVEDKQVKEAKKLTPKSIDGRFRIVRELGRGAAGVVYEGVQLSVDRRVAIKVLHADHQRNSDYIERFSREAKAIARLSHTNCITLFDFGFSEEFRSHYMVMEFIEGEELFSITRDQPLPFRVALRIGIQIAEAIAHAHKHGILHRDLKPENVLVTTDWEAKVLDFGLARLLDLFSNDTDGRRLTAQGAVFGTPAYMSPEQCAGDLDVTVRSDIYSLGVVLYELFEGMLPFESNEVVKTLVMHAKDPPPPMHADVPQEIKDLIFQMLEKDPLARPRTGLQVADTLRAVLINTTDLSSSNADISQEIQRELLRGLDRTDQTGENIRITEDGLEKSVGINVDMSGGRTETMDLVGHRLGEYIVGQPLGEGSMSTVFRGSDPSGEPVALKVVGHKVPEELRASDRFHREVEVLTRLHAPTIVTLLDSGYATDVDRLFLVTEIVVGNDLDSLCRSGRAPSELALLVAEDVARALHTAHEHDVIHRDLKPSNVMLVPGSDGRVRAKVLDFGLARLVGDPTRLTVAGMSVGTVLYMAPEVLRGEDASTRSDLYSLGVLLYQMLCGHQPFEAKARADAAKNVATKNPPPLSSFVQEVPKDLSKLVSRLMSKAPAARPRDAAEVLAQLGNIREQMTIREFRVDHQGRAADIVTAWRLRRAVHPPTPPDPSQPSMPVAKRPSPSAPPTRVIALNDDDRPLDWRPSTSSAWIAVAIAVLTIALVIIGFMLFGDGGL